MSIFDFLPVSREDMHSRDMYYYDFLLVTGDAYVDHPSFGAAVIGRVLEAEGYRVAVLPQPTFQNASEIAGMGRPRYAALVTAGNLDSMVAHYTAAKKPRSEDYYSPGKKSGRRPDRAVLVYSKLVREAFPDLPIIIGGLEASLRRFAHYDYWEDKVRRPILFDSGADFLVFGMGEAAVVQLAKRIAAGDGPGSITDIRGTAYIHDMSITKVVHDAMEVTGDVSSHAFPAITCASFEEVSAGKREYARAAMMQYDEFDPVRGKAVMQHCDGRVLTVNPPSLTLTTAELDRIYDLPFTREVHPMYDKAGGVPAIDEVRFSVIHNRGCFGACNFCALSFHQGRTVASRSHESVIREVERFTSHPQFKGNVHDVGGPTANFRRPSCKQQLKTGICADRSCLSPPCENLDTDHTDYLLLLRKLTVIPGVNKVFVRSGIRFDYMMLDRSGEFFAELVKNHISGQLKVAPEHCVDNVLYYMGKPRNAAFEKFSEKFKRLNVRYKKEQYLVPYFISSHPGSTVNDAIALAEYLKRTGRHPEQVQDFYPTPGTLSTCMYYTGIDPRTMKPVSIPHSPREKAVQRALLQWSRPKNRAIVQKALRDAGRGDLIGYGKHCLVKPCRRTNKQV
jgi:uncharacterized radical SAM protein YgiQ